MTTRTSERKPISSCIQGHVMNAKTKGKDCRVSYSRITFATLESHRDTPSLVLSFFLLPVRVGIPSSSKHIFPEDGDARYSFVYRAVRTRTTKPEPLANFHSFTSNGATENIRHERCCENSGKIASYFTCFER